MSGGSYFVDHRKGEVNELKALLRNPKIDKDVKKKMEVMKKVIAFQTQGIDVSRCFSEMVMAGGATKNPILKKIVYHYLCTYAQQSSELAILAINTLRKDCSDDDPMVCGMALRSLCSLRLPNLEEYVQVPIRRGLAHPSSYVRKTAVMGITKLFRLVPQYVKDSDLVDVLYGMLRDQDTQVITNVICTLNEVLVSEGKMAINSKIVLYLLNRLHEFSEWGQCTVLELIARYKPSSDDEMFDIMNLLESRLQHANAAVVMGACTVFLSLTRGHPAIFQQVFQRIKSPLLTQMGGGSEVSFVLLSHIKVLVSTVFPGVEGSNTAAAVFADSYKQFFVGFNDPAASKSLKLDILAQIADGRTGSEIVNEVAEYITDVDTNFACKAIESLGLLALRLPVVLDEVVAQLLSFLKLGIPYVTAQTIIVVKDLLRKYPERHSDVLPMLEKCLTVYVSASLNAGGAPGGAGSSAAVDSASRLAIVWILGEWGEFVDQAPYLLELFVGGWDDEPDREVRLELLTSAMRLFFKRPPEMQKVLGQLLGLASKDVSRVEVRDRALMYYRLLQHDVHEAARVVNSPKPAVDSFMELDEERRGELQAQIFDQFNSLSSVFGQPEETFTRLLRGDITEDEEEEVPAEEAAALQELDEQQGSGSSPEQQQQPVESPGASAGGDFLFGDDSQQLAEDLGGLSMAGADAGLDLDDFLGGAPAAPSLQLVPVPACNPQVFQAKWAQLPVTAVLEAGPVRARSVAEVDAATSSLSLKTMASGSVNGTIKFYVFGQTEASEFVFVEVIVNEGSGALRATVKSDVEAHGDLLKDQLQQAFGF